MSENSMELDMNQECVTHLLDFIWQHSTLISVVVVLGIGIPALRHYNIGSVCKNQNRLDGKTVIITGANTGIGKETAKDLARRGARVILACRDASRAEKAAVEIRQETGNENVIVRIVNLASLESVRKFCQTIIDTEDRLDILINNAGVYGCPALKTDDGFEMHFGVNYLAHFLLTNLLLNLLRASQPSRILNVTSGLNMSGVINFDDINSERNYNPHKAYCQSKLANICFTTELHDKLQGTKISVFSLHPGLVDTEVFRYSKQKTNWLHAVVDKVLWSPLTWMVMKTPVAGAQTSIYCAVENGLPSGQYYSNCGMSRWRNSKSTDRQITGRLWKLSAEMVGLEETL